MTVLWVCVGFILLIVWVLTIVDLVSAHLPMGKTAAWLLLILLLPFVGAIAYWATRKPKEGDADAQYLAEAEARHSRASQPFDSTRLGP